MVINKIYYKILLIYILFIFKINSIYATPANGVTANNMFGGDDIISSLKGGSLGLIPTVDNIIGYLIGLFYFISVTLIVYGGFVILTSGGDDEKMKKGKNIIIYVMIGLIVVFLASNIVLWIIDVMSDNDIVGT